MIEIIMILLLGAIGSAAVVYYKEDADLTISLNKGILLGVSVSENYYELEEEIDYTYQVALGVLILTLTWTRDAK